MSDFDNIQNLWQQQQSKPIVGASAVINKAASQQKKAKRKQTATIIVLATLALILAILWLITPLGNMVSTGLSIMFAAIFSRVALEAYSYRRLLTIKIDELSEEYRRQIKRYYKLRKNLVSIITILTVTLYIVGFIIMLPTFKTTLPNWFYIYIVMFLIIAIPVGSYLLIKQARTEIKDIKEVIDML